MMDSNQDDDLFTIDDFEKLSSNSKSTSSNKYNEKFSDLLSPSVKSGHKRSVPSPSCSPSPKRTAFSPQANIPMIMHLNPSDPQKHQRQKDESDLSSNQPTSLLVEEISRSSPSNADKIHKLETESNKKLILDELSDQPTSNSADSIQKTVQVGFAQQSAKFRTIVIKSSEQEIPTVIKITSENKNLVNANGTIETENRVGVQEDLCERNFERKSNSIKSLGQKKEKVHDNSKFLKPTRIFKNSHKYNTAVRLNTNNVSAEVLEAVLFDSLEGELILAEYQDMSFLKPTTQHKLVEILVSRTSKHLLGSRKMNEYCSKLADAIVILFSNEEKNMYYIPPNDDCIDAKGKLANKWRDLKKSLRASDVLPKTSAKHIDTENLNNLEKCNVLPRTSIKRKDTMNADNLEKITDSEKKKDLYLTDDVKADLEWLRKYSEPVEAMRRWKATYKYRCETRTLVPRCVNEYLEEWPILKSSYLFSFINYDFQMTFKSYNPSVITLLWGKFFNELYQQRSSAVAQLKGREILEIYQKSSSKALNKMQMEGLQMLLLPYLLPPPSIIKAVSGFIRATINESANGFVIWSETYQSIRKLLSEREARYKQWGEKAQPCIVLEGESADCINACYLYIGTRLWKIDKISPVSALQLLFKFYTAFNLKFPVDCTSIWLVIIQVVFKVTPKNYKVSPTIQLLCEELKKKLEVGEPREG